MENWKLIQQLSQVESSCKLSLRSVLHFSEGLQSMELDNIQGHDRTGSEDSNGVKIKTRRHADGVFWYRSWGIR